ncbi:DNA polymerase alpha/epsilon subunit B-domain-containing protein [Mycena sp. CBHHK59/15]|nr:DNA polymerase alpha/epsilon subunit B-domain-containing protein [Mycena sp. CBHHK59/15]
MSLEALTQEINTRFPDVAPDAKLVAECVAVCQNYNITPEELQYKWEAFNFKPSATRSEISPYTMDSLSALKVQIHRDMTSKSAQKEQPRSSLVATINRGAFRNRNPGPKLAPVHVKVEPTDGFGMVGIAGPSKVSFRGLKNDAPSRKKRAYRYMHETPSDRGDVLDQKIDEFATLIKNQYSISDLGDPSSSTSDDITVVGRITHDSDSTEEASKLTEGSIALESARSMGNGQRIALRFDWNLKIRGGAQGSGGTVFYPGALVALRGKNGGGGYFQVSEVLIPPPLKPSVAVKPDARIDDSAFSMFIASGPYTPESDLGFKPWRALLQKINAAKPTIVLLLGPFVDTLHPLIKSGDVDSTPLNLFRTRFTDPLRAYLDSMPGSIAILIPSVRDLISDHAVFPQSELPSELSRADPRIHLLPNPASFTINDITFGATSVDVLFHMKKGEFLKRGEEVDPTPAVSADDSCTDPIANACRQLLQQRSFYPVFPVPLELSAEVNLDVTHSSGLKVGDDEELAPDVLIVPSRFKQFSKTVYATTVLNPSFLSKGSYVVLDVGAGSTGGVKERLSPRVLKLDS